MYLHMNRVCPIEKSLNNDSRKKNRKRQREKAGGGLRINHNRLQSEASFFFLHFFSLVPLNQSYASIILLLFYCYIFSLLSLSLLGVVFVFCELSVWICLIGSQRWLAYKQRRLINSSSKLYIEQLQSFPFSISSVLIGVKYLIYTISYGYT